MKRIFALISLFVAALAACGAPEVGQPAPDFTATDIHGKTVKLSDYKGKIVVIETYDSRSPRTFREYSSGTMPLIQHFLATNGVVYLVLDSGMDQLTPESANWEMGNRKMQITDWIIDGPGAPLTELYGLETIGQMFVIDKNGTIAYAGGFDDAESPAADPRVARNYVLRSVRELLAGKAVSIPHAPVFDSASGAETADAAPEIGKPAPNFSATDIDGKKFRFSDYRGRIVVLESFEADCPFVELEYQSGLVERGPTGRLVLNSADPKRPTGSMQRLQAQLATNGVVWLTLNEGGAMTPDKAKKDMADRKMVVAHYIIDDPDHSLARRYRIWVTPQMFVVDKKGVLAYMGAIDDVQNEVGDRLTARNYVRQAVNELLAGKRVSVPETKPFGCALMYPGMWNAAMFQPPGFDR